MFEGLPQKLRSDDLPADVRLLLILQKSIDKGLVKTLGDLYNVIKGIVVKDPTMMAPYTRAYYDYFLNIDIQNGDRLSDAIKRSETFRQWRDDNLDRFGDDIEIEDLVNRFLDDVHLTSYDIKEIISGREIWDSDDPSKSDEEEDGNYREAEARKLDKMAD